jgi:hypothetical protein
MGFFRKEQIIVHRRVAVLLTLRQRGAMLRRNKLQYPYFYEA